MIKQIVVIIKNKDEIVVYDDKSGYIDLPCVEFMEDINDFVQRVKQKYGINIKYKKDLFKFEDKLWRLCTTESDCLNQSGCIWLNFDEVMQYKFKNNLQKKLSEFVMKSKSKEQVKLIYGLKNDRIIHISDIKVEERGIKCNCICPNCGDDLQAKLGHGKKTPHFAHNCNECDLEIAAQTALHILAKEILDTKREIVIPAYKIQISDDDFKHQSKDLRWDEIEKLKKEFIYSYKKRIKFERVFLEKKIENIVPDIIIEMNGKQLMIEIAVTHFVDDNKAQLIKNLNISALEIDLSDLKHTEFERENLEEIIINNTTNKKWIYNVKQNEANQKLRELNETVLVSVITQRELQDAAKKARAKEEADALRKQNEKQQKSRQMIEDALNENNYSQEIEKRRNSIKAFQYIKYKKFYNECKQGVPFYVDIPITGEIAFDCDRRIWQSAIFDKFIYYRSNQEENHCVICFAKIWSWLTNYQKDFKINWELNKSKQFQINGCEYNKTLLYLAVKQYLMYLGFIGFIEYKDKIEFYSDYKITPKQVIPPNNENASILMRVLSENIQTNSLIDEIVGKETINKSRCGSLSYIPKETNRLYSQGMNQEYINKCNENKLNAEKKRQTEYLLGKNEAMINFDLSPEPVFIDTYDRRWLICDKCKQFKREDEMAFYQEKTGVCSACFRQKK